MLGSLGFFASKGMTTVPNLSGLTKTEAETAIAAAYLTVGTATSVSTSTSGLNNTIESQAIESGSVVDYDTTINFGYYTYVSAPSPTPPTPVPCTGAQNQRFPTSWSGDCVNGSESGTYVIETCYDNCNCVTNTYTETRSCSTPVPCVSSGQQTFPAQCTSCSGGTKTCSTCTEYSYTNCDPVVNCVDSTVNCTTPTPTPSPTPSPAGAPSPLANPAPSAFPPGTPIGQACIDEDTFMIKVESDGSKTEVMAKDIAVGDYVLGLRWDELIDQDMYNYLNASSDNLTNPEVVPTIVVAKYEYSKNTTMYFNKDESTRMSLEQPVLVNRDNLWIWASSGDVYIGDKIVRYTEDGYSVEETVNSVDYISETRNVYAFNCEETDTFFAGNVLVHNK
jgi:hypothetical protein